VSNTLFLGQVSTIVRNARMICFSFAPQGAAAPKILFGQGIKSITRTSAGLWVVNFAKTYRFMIEAQLTPSFSALTTQIVQFQGINVTARGAGKQSATILNQTTAGVATDIAANANNSIYGEIFVQNA
jgi:hypothetical protein